MDKTTNKVISELAKKLDTISEAALLTHISPDGDCIGSMLALGIALEGLNKKICYYNPGFLPVNLKFLPGVDKICSVLPPEEFPETLIFIDCAEAERAYSGLCPEFLQGKTVINIDHHISNNGFGTVNWIDAGAAATGEMIFHLLGEMGVSMTKEIAENLYTAIITDTGRFSYSNTTVESFRIAAELLKTGLDLVQINNILFEQKSLAQTRLLQKALTNLELHQQGTMAVIVLTREDFEETGADESLSEGLVNYARNIEKVEAAALLKEIAPDEIKVSFRSNTWLDVNQVASRFGGGGHRRASGCSINGTMGQARKMIVSALEEALNVGRDH
ncbi:bifunctional oligoribonuclease/PAP phosphatase NrnA [Dehalobacter sp. TBBPA1]|uniref:DHH family phosphoesterase n=1 Tax=Dehalobacter sp. TBBPA1 TaxID=3235037 RepID=UPI0034A2F713